MNKTVTSNTQSVKLQPPYYRFYSVSSDEFNLLKICDGSSSVIDVLPQAICSSAFSLRELCVGVCFLQNRIDYPEFIISYKPCLYFTYYLDKDGVINTMSQLDSNLDYLSKVPKYIDKDHAQVESHSSILRDLLRVSRSFLYKQGVARTDRVILMETLMGTVDILKEWDTYVRG